MTTAITTLGGTTVSLEYSDGELLVILTAPDAPADLRRVEAGRVVHGGFQPITRRDYAMRPDVLRIIGDLVERAVA